MVALSSPATPVACGMSMEIVSAYGIILVMANKKNPAAVELGRLGGQARVPKGVSVLTEEERSERGRQAAEKRWGKKKKKAPK